jgi:hypothetical protein
MAIQSTFCSRVVAVTAVLLLSACADTVSVPPTEGGPATLSRLTEAQYRNIIADVFGDHIVVAGRFDPLLRTDGLIAFGASQAMITPSGFERFNQIARSVAVQVVNETNREILIPCTPADSRAYDDDCAGAFLAPAGRYLFRRTLAGDELDVYLRIAREAASTRSDFYVGLSYALQGMLLAPDFLFVAETAEPDPGSPGSYRLDALSTASRLSFLLWNSNPDEELLDAAESGRLLADGELTRHVDRMMLSPRFKTGVRAFFEDMLKLEELADLQKDTQLFPAFSVVSVEDTREQLLRTLLDLLVVQQGDYRDIFTTRKTFISSPLALVYRIPTTVPGGWAPYEFPDGDTRAGIQTQLSFVALHSHPGKSSPTLRGMAIRELLLCQKVPDPPSEISFDQFNDADTLGLTARERLTAHNEDPACAGCHKLMDPIGLALETFDAAGQLRTLENGVLIDTSGELNGIAFDDAVGLAYALREDPAASSCVVNRLYGYATGRPLEQTEWDWIAHLEQAFAKDGYRFPDLVRRIATSKATYAISPEWVMTANSTEETTL